MRWPFNVNAWSFVEPHWQIRNEKGSIRPGWKLGGTWKAFSRSVTAYVFKNNKLPLIFISQCSLTQNTPQFYYYYVIIIILFYFIAIHCHDITNSNSRTSVCKLAYILAPSKHINSEQREVWIRAPLIVRGTKFTFTTLIQYKSSYSWNRLILCQARVQ